NMWQPFTVIFDTEASIQSDDAIVMGATVTDSMGPDLRFRLCITRHHAERRWRIPFSRERIAAHIWMHFEEFESVVTRELGNGKTELVL
ncbi:hypothetical protein, partial [Hyphomicrobium sp.]|uniref:hypothetical protein n=1 Tax=Hyphomicrobium sp. TaxID=82 RepID=UPI0025BA5655